MSFLLHNDELKSVPGLQTPFHFCGIADSPSSLKLADSGQTPVSSTPIITSSPKPDAGHSPEAGLSLRNSGECVVQNSTESMKHIVIRIKKLWNWMVAILCSVRFNLDGINNGRMPALSPKEQLNLQISLNLFTQIWWQNRTSLCWSFIAVIFGVFGANVSRYKICSWIVIIFSVLSLANIRNIENDLKQISLAMMFGITGLITNYFLSSFYRAILSQLLMALILANTVKIIIVHFFSVHTDTPLRLTDLLVETDELIFLLWKYVTSTVKEFNLLQQNPLEESYKLTNATVLSTAAFQFGASIIFIWGIKLWSYYYRTYYVLSKGFAVVIMADRIAEGLQSGCTPFSIAAIPEM
ncbi:hypothetical protein H5410_053586 [Solanum commersonii]|uniref:Uncharacterized protein n=1 Tax=Solanum commersonii TaxID=4109 RepID=A0A9J5X5A4_SOLCO|nr:hypothetical protein H5410_053586 [Solanum commersonii]